MNLGAENRNKVIAAVSLVVVAVVLMATRFSGFLGSGSSSASIPPAAELGDRASQSPTPPRHVRLPAEAERLQKSRAPRSRLILLCEPIS